MYSVCMMAINSVDVELSVSRDALRRDPSVTDTICLINATAPDSVIN